MRGFLSSLTAVVVFVHAVLGCCSHHSHACGEMHDSLAPIVGDHCADVRHSSTDGSEARSADDHQGRDDCKGSRCEMVRRGYDRPIELSPFVYQFSGPALHLADQVSNNPFFAQNLCTNGILLMPVRLHLMNQVLLI